MIRSKGTNEFENNKFSFWAWSADVLQTPKEVMEKVRELKLVGRVVRDIITIDMAYNWTDNGICESIFNQMEIMHPVLRGQIPNPDDFLPNGVELMCYAEIDDPLLIEFEDGDVLAISFDDGSCVRMGLNEIPRSINGGPHGKNFHANRLFRDMIGKPICAVEVTASTEEPEFTFSHGLVLEEQPEYVTEICLVYEDGSHCLPRRKLSFQAEYDFCWVSLVDHDGAAVKVPTSQVPWITEGYLKV